MRRIVVVGGGLAGAHAVHALRANGFAGQVALVGTEAHLPYDRPPLSKSLLAGEVDDTTLETSYDGVELRLGERAIGLRPGLLSTDGADLPYDGLVIATGSTPRTIPGARLLRTVDDARALRAVLVPGAPVTIVGAGWIGAEVATVAARRGASVNVLEAAEAPLAQALGADVGALTIPWYAEAGVALRCGAPVADVAAPGADVVVAGVGVRPATDWLLDSGVRLDATGAVVVDEQLRTSLPGVVAAGDCTAWWSRRFGARLHVEHWDNALHAPAVAVRALLGEDVVYDPVPYFWSEQFGRMVQYVGHRDGADQLVERGSPTEPSWALAWLRGGELVAFLAVDRPRDLLQARKAIAARARPDPARLADPSVAVRAAGP